MARMLKTTITNGLEKILTKFPNHDKFIFCIGLNRSKYDIISNSSCINNLDIVIFIVWSISIKKNIGIIKGLNCLIKAPPLKF